LESVWPLDDIATLEQFERGTAGSPSEKEGVTL